MRRQVLSEDTVHKCDSVVLTQIDKITDDVSCILYPNPTTDNASIQLMSTKMENVSLILTDISGKTICDKSFQVYGTYNQNISLDHLEQSIYVLKIGIGNQSKTFKIIKL